MIIHIIIYILLCLYGVLFSVLYNQYIIMAVVIMLAIMPIVSYIFTIVASKFIKITVSSENNAVCKQENLKVLVTIYNKSVIPISYAVIGCKIGYPELPNAKREKLKCSIPAGHSVQYGLEVSSEFSGMLQIILGTAKFYDLFRIFFVRKKCNICYKVIIFPQLQLLDVKKKDRFVFTEQESEEYYEDRRGNDPSQVFDIREYREGDRLQRIHWKLSFKKDVLLVKEFSEPVIVDTMIIFDLYCGKTGVKGAREREGLYEKTVNLSYTLFFQGVYHHIIWLNDKNQLLEKRKIVTEDDFYIAVNELGYMGCCQNNNNFADVFVLSEQQHAYSNIFYVGKNSASFLEKGVQVEVVS